MAPQSATAGSVRPSRHVERDLKAVTLFEQLAKAVPCERQALRNRILELHLDLCDALAAHYAGKGIERDDLVQVARLGLVHAINRYHPERGSFVGFAIPTINGELKRYFRDHGWAVRPPRRLQEVRLRYLAAQEAASHDGIAAPCESDLLASLQCDRRTLAECQNLSAAYSPLSLDRGGSDESDDAELTHLVATVDENLEFLAVRLSLQRAIAALSPRRRTILHWRFVEECTQREIADRLSISQMQVSRILGQIIDELRARLNDHDEQLLAS
jgi:RNA polymerase sigma-B factor